jgi:carboxyl-terminal processing protease
MFNSRKIQSWLPFLLSIMIIVGMAIGFRLYRHIEWRDRPSAGGNSSSTQQVLDLIKFKYVDSISLDTIELAGLQALTEKLDPHSVFIPMENLSEVEAELTGHFSGIGVEYQMIRDTMVVVSIIDKGPAAQAGIQTGDIFIAVNDSAIAGQKITDQKLRGMLRGKRASKVKVTLLRNGGKIEKEIIRGDVPMPSLDAFYMIAPGVGYIKLNRFAETTFFEFMDAASALNKKGMQKLILDLRGNGGGLMEEATKIADELLEDGLTIVETKGAKLKTQSTIATKPGLFEKGSIVVLLDEQSASASEVLAGALQDHDRATIIGRRSFGKGLVQEQYRLANGGALRLTVARYYTPLGRSIQKPYDNGTTAYKMEVLERFHAGSTAYQTDTAGKKIFTTRKGKKLYESGGISPDIWVPFDSTLLPAPLVRVYNSNLMNEWVYDIFKMQRSKLNEFKTPTEFSGNFQLNDTDWQQLQNRASIDSIVLKPFKENEKQQLALRVKALFARYRWRNQGYFEILNTEDPTITTAIQYLQSNP